MPQIINTNVASLNAQRNLNASQSDANTALQRLSSGLRINSAKDDAAGLAISNRLTAQINGINQAIRNAGDGISVAQVAEGALNETGNILQRIRELAVQSANASNSAADRTALQSEVNQLVSEVDRIANNTAFGSSKLLNGSFTGQQFQVGANVGETIGVSISSAKSTDIGQVNTATFAGLTSARVNLTPAGTSAISEETLTFVVAGETTTVAVAAGDSAKEIASNVSSQVAGLQASATTTTIISDVTGTAGSGTATVEINGVNLGALAYDDADTFVVALETAIEANGQLNGTLSVSSDTTADTVTIVDADGDDITVAITGQSGATAGFDVNSVASDGTTEDATYGDVTLANGDTTVATGDIDFTTSVATTGSVTIASSDTIANGAIIGTSAVAATIVDSGDRVGDVDISTVNGANDAIAIIDAALTQVDAQRADLGAIQNRFESVIANLSNVSENSAAARSRIQDADFAQETANLARAQILQQAGISVLAQANAQPQNVLALLQ